MAAARKRAAQKRLREEEGAEAAAAAAAPVTPHPLPKWSAALLTRSKPLRADAPIVPLPRGVARKFVAPFLLKPRLRYSTKEYVDVFVHLIHILLSNTEEFNTRILLGAPTLSIGIEKTRRELHDWEIQVTSEDTKHDAGFQALHDYALAKGIKMYAWGAKVAVSYSIADPFKPAARMTRAQQAGLPFLKRALELVLETNEPFSFDIFRAVRLIRSDDLPAPRSLSHLASS